MFQDEAVNFSFFTPNLAFFVANHVVTSLGEPSSMSTRCKKYVFLQQTKNTKASYLCTV